MTVKLTVFPTLAEWTCAPKGDFRGREGEALQTALFAKELEILSATPQTQTDALVQLRFCAIFLERNGGRTGLAADAIRNAANVLAVSLGAASPQYKATSPIDREALQTPPVSPADRQNRRFSIDAL
jgi:hypothetical protein